MTDAEQGGYTIAPLLLASTKQVLVRTATSSTASCSTSTPTVVSAAAPRSSLLLLARPARAPGGGGGVQQAARSSSSQCVSSIEASRHRGIEAAILVRGNTGATTAHDTKPLVVSHHSHAATTHKNAQQQYFLRSELIGAGFLASIKQEP